MKIQIRVLLFLPLLAFWVNGLNAQSVNNVHAVQKGNSVEISYDIGDAGVYATFFVQLFMKTKDGWIGPLKSVTGDVGSGISGKCCKKIEWQALRDYQPFEGNYTFKVSATANEISANKRTYESTVTDIDGNVYNTVLIGNQLWMKENLKVTRFRNGDFIKSELDENGWSNASYPASATDNEVPDYLKIFGRVYNWYCIVDPRKLCPTGWRIPSSSDFKILIDYLGGENTSGLKLKAISYHWGRAFTGTNESGFSGLPGGERGNEGYFVGSLSAAYTFGNYKAHWYGIDGDFELTKDNRVQIMHFIKTGNSGLSVRCLSE